jgi:hypothetical protein
MYRVERTLSEVIVRGPRGFEKRFRNENGTVVVRMEDGAPRLLQTQYYSLTDSEAIAAAEEAEGVWTGLFE